jgi:hypothetical protein
MNIGILGFYVQRGLNFHLQHQDQQTRWNIEANTDVDTVGIE